MNLIKGSSLISTVSYVGKWVKHSAIVTMIKKWAGSSRIVRAIYQYNPSKHHGIDNSFLFREKGDQENKRLMSINQPLIRYIPFKWIRKSFFISQIITFLECEDEDRIS